ncbi:MFS transporter [uncultured Sphingomonas sp.]|uniref:MFS transporter n=1 Tax=uncultured Sphingomonas sp. TaxID=158754 RepID=UPI0035CAC3C5
MASRTIAAPLMPVAPVRADGEQRLPVSLCLGFGVGSFGIAILLNTVTTFFPALMTTVLGQSAAIAGLLLTVSKLYDAFADIAIGMVSDRTRSPIGRRRPFLLAGALIGGLSFLLLFVPPHLSNGALALWMGFALIVYSTGYSLFSVPYVAMAGEMTDGYHERTRLLSYRAFFAMLGQLLASAGTAVIITWAGGGRPGYAAMGIATAVLMAGSMIGSFHGTRQARIVQPEQATRTLGRGAALRALASNRPFVLLMLIKICQYMGIAIINTTKLLFLLNIVHVGYVGLINLTLVQNVVSALCVPLWAWAARRFGKRPAYLVSTAILAIVYLSWFWTGPGLTMPAIWLRGAANGVAAAGTTLLSVAMLPDVMEYDRLRTGLRREGIFSSIYSIVEKLSFALGAGVVGLLLAAGGYIPTLKGAIVNQPATAVSALYVGASLLPAALMTGSFLLMLFYPLNEARLKRAREMSR